MKNSLHNRQLPPLIHIAMCHYQFEAIHPFLDGNGRIGRLLISLLLVEREILPSPILYLSAFFEATRDEYYRQLYNVSSKGTWGEWLIYFLSGVAIQAEDVLSRAERINALLTAWKIKMAGTKPAVSLEIIDQLAINPYFTINKIVGELGIPYTSAQRSVKNLENMGMVRRTRDSRKEGIYCATDIMAILEEPTKITMSF